jgi:hypothetical protein
MKATFLHPPRRNLRAARLKVTGPRTLRGGGLSESAGPGEGKQLHSRRLELMLVSRIIREGDLLGPGPDKYLENNHDISPERFTIIF